MSFFNDAQKDALLTGQYICCECGALMAFEDENEDILVCLNCGHSVDLDYYGMTEDECDALYQTEEEVCKDNEHYGESYEEVYDELSDD